MKFPNLNYRQQQLLSILEETIGKEDIEGWLLTRNIHFNNKCPVDYILSENYEYFSQFYL